MPDAAARTHAEHSSLVLSLQAEHFADDLEPPAEAISWSETDLRSWFEGGGDIAVDESAAPELIIPFGEWCALATIFEALHARSAGFPLDWVYSSLPLLLRFLSSDCAPEALLSSLANLRHVLPHNRTSPCTHEWQAAFGAEADKLTSNDAERAAWPVDESKPPSPAKTINEGDGLQAGCHVQDTITGAVFPHDFGQGQLEPQFERVLAKYQRRCDRLRSALQGRSVLLLHVRNGYLSGRESPHDPAILHELDGVLRRWPRVRLESWNAIDEPLQLGRVRHHVQPLFHAPDDRDKHVWIVIGLRLIELNVVGDGGEVAKAAVLQGAKQLLQVASAPGCVDPSRLEAANAPHGNAPIEAVVISLPHRADRREAFFSRWHGPKPRISHAIDGRALLTRRDVPVRPSSQPHLSPCVRALLDDWRASMCIHDAAWGSQQPKKFAAVAACHSSHLLLWDEFVRRSGPDANGGDDDGSILIVMEDDAAFPSLRTHVPSWFAEQIAPLLPDDWSICYLNEPLKRMEQGGSRARRTKDPTKEWSVISADDAEHPAARCVREIDGVPPTEAYAIRRSGAQRLLQFSATHGLGAVDYVIAKAFAGPDELAAFPIDQPYLDLLGSPDDVRRGAQAAMAASESMSHRIFLVEPPVACQAMGTADSDIQNWVLIEGKEVHVSEMFRAMLTKA